jgi:hypothetical protein
MPDIFVNPNKPSEKDTHNAEEVAEETNPEGTSTKEALASAEASLSEAVPQETAAKAEAYLPPNLKISGPTPIHGFSTYKELPEGVTFDTQEDDETILLFLRRDFITNVPWIAGAIILIFAPFLLGFVIRFSNSPFAFFPFNFVLILEIFYYLVVTAYVFVSFITWYFNVSLITNKRVIDVDFEDLIYKNVAGTKLSLVQDVSFTQIGAIRAVFDYGDVLIQTAGAVDNFILDVVPRPERVVQIVEALLGKGKNAV